MELFILDWIQAHLRCGFLDAVLPIISWTANHGEIWILLALALVLRKSSRRQGWTVALALVLDLVCCNLLLKPLIGRVRPFAVNPAVELLVSPPLDASFPSGHTAASFAAVFALRGSGSPLWKPALAVAVLIAFSRLYLYVHYPTDVIFSMFAGILLGLLGCLIVAIVYKFLPEKRGKYQRKNV